MSLVQMSLSAALMIVAIIILRALTIERFPKKTFLVLWWIALLRLLIPFSIPSVMSIYSWISPDVPKAVHQEVQEITESQSTSEPVLKIPSEILQNASPQEDAVSAVPEQTRSEVVENSTQFEMTPIPDTDIEYVEVKPSKSFSEIFFDMLPAIWGVGIGVIAAFFGINYWKGIREFRTRPEDWPEELRPIAGSLYPGGPAPVSRAALAGAIARELLGLCPAFDCLDEYRARCFVPGHWVTVCTGTESYAAKAVAIDDAGRLIVQREGGRTEALCHGEVSIRPSPLAVK